MQSLATGILQFMGRRADPLQAKLLNLWREWDELFGPMAEEIVPLGHKNTTLLLGAYSSVALQEYRFAADQILFPVNTFLGEEVFFAVRLELVNGRTPLSRLSLFPGIKSPLPPVLDKIGFLDLPADSPVGRAYARFVAFHKAGK